MSTRVAKAFCDDINVLRERLDAIEPGLANVPWRVGGWTRKQIVGHLLDSAANNRQRFVRGALDGSYNGPGYAQDRWVELQGYSEQSWETLLGWWQAEHEMLASIVDRIPDSRLEAQCVIGGGDPVTLAFVIDDYVAHQQHHLAQITASSA